MRYGVFAQHADRVDLVGLVKNGSRFFEADVSIQGELARAELEAPYVSGIRLAAQSRRRGWTGAFTIRVRPVTTLDVVHAREAEARCSQWGMSVLAERCPSMWDLEPADGTPLAAELVVAALLASVALGPVLPEDGSGLFGVRTAMQRVDELLGKSLER